MDRFHLYSVRWIYEGGGLEVLLDRKQMVSEFVCVGRVLSNMRQGLRIEMGMMK